MDKVKILFLAANPSRDLRLDEEIREIATKIRAAKHRDALELVSCWAVRRDDLQQALLEHQPHVLHFSGHGNPSEEIILQDEDSKPYPFSQDVLVDLLRTLKDNLKLVVLNACYSRSQAEAIAKVVDCTVGMNKAIGDEAAIKFAAAFYRALGFGRSVQTAFELGLNAMTTNSARKQQASGKHVHVAKTFATGIQLPAAMRGKIAVLPVWTRLSASVRIECCKAFVKLRFGAGLMTSEADKVRLVRIFVSSPGDVAKEREALDEVVDGIIQTDGQRGRFRVELWKWEEHATPQMGPEPQSVIDAQMPTNYEIYLGILAHRFGTPTGKFGSGTEKEFNDALKRWESTKRPWILLYFKKAMVDPSTLDWDQYKKVLAFQQSVQPKGLYAEYEGLDGSKDSFVRQVDLHLRKVIPSVLEGPGPVVPASDPGEPTIPPSYLDWLKRQCADVDLLGLRVQEGCAPRINHVYVPLTTTARNELAVPHGGDPSEESLRNQEEDQKPQLLLDLLDRQSLYLAGAPGSGKSTFCRWVAWLCCEGHLPNRDIQEPDDYQERFPNSLKDRLPLLVRLRDFWRYLPPIPGARELSQLQLESALGDWLDATNPGGLDGKTLLQYLQFGKALLAFDGVDEVPLVVGEESGSWHPRAMLLSALSEAAATWTEADHRVLVTSRPYGIRSPEREKLGLNFASIEELAVPLQDLLVQRWFHILAEDKDAARGYAEDMLRHVRERAHVGSLVTNPMLLTAMCVIYNEGKRLPQDKHELYDRIVENVLYNRFDPGLIDLIRHRLCVIAHGMHTGAGLSEDRTNPQAETTTVEIDRMLRVYRKESSWDEQALQGTAATREQILSQSGLLLPRADQRAAFYHLSIQEYLAALRILDVDLQSLSDVFVKRAAIPEWHNTLSFLFGSLLATNVSPRRNIDLVNELIDRATDDQLGLQVVIGDCLEMLLAKTFRLKQQQEDKYRQMCVDAIANEVPLRERNLLGLALGRIGDPRVVPDLRAYDNEQAWVQIPADTYRVGDDDKSGYGDYFKPLDEQDFVAEGVCGMTRFPVTNSQFAVFMDEGGYGERKWWSDDGWQWLQQENVAEPRFWHSSRWNSPNQPVVGVAFWEAEAFCKWAGGRLPTEREWEAAARGPSRSKYPWDGDWQDGICNSREAGIEATTAVGLFPSSRSASFGLDDMAGNVWEWCQDEHEDWGRVLRGGSWIDLADNCGCSSRNVNDPSYRFNLIGFRLARTYS